MLNHIIIMGRMTRDPEVRQAGGVPVASFSVAVDRDYKDKNTGTAPTDFIEAVAWRGMAEHIARFFQKGSMVVVEGRLQMEDWTDKDGNKRRSAKVNVSAIHFGESKREADARRGGSGNYESAGGGYGNSGGGYGGGNSGGGYGGGNSGGGYGGGNSGGGYGGGNSGGGYGGGDSGGSYGGGNSGGSYGGGNSGGSYGGGDSGGSYGGGDSGSSYSGDSSFGGAPSGQEQFSTLSEADEGNLPF